MRKSEIRSVSASIRTVYPRILSQKGQMAPLSIRRVLKPFQDGKSIASCSVLRVVNPPLGCTDPRAECQDFS